MSVELKPCPFCGSKAEFTIHVHSEGIPGGVTFYSVGVKCTKCSLAECKPSIGCLFFDDFRSYIESEKVRVAKIWNRRSA